MRIISWASICFMVSTTTETTISRLVPPKAERGQVGDRDRDDRRRDGDDGEEERAGEGDPGDDAAEILLRSAVPAGCPG